MFSGGKVAPVAGSVSRTLSAVTTGTAGARGIFPWALPSGSLAETATARESNATANVRSEAIVAWRKERKADKDEDPS